MSGRIIAAKENQPGVFAFTPKNLEQAKKIIAKYPAGRQASAVMPLLYLVQRQQEGNWVPTVAMDYVADMLDMPPIKVYEVATFYTMFNLAPVSKHLLQVCRTTPCWLRGSDEVTQAICDHAGIGFDETSADGQFTLMEVECLGACVNAPIVQINDDYYEDVTPARMKEIMDELKAGKNPARGSQIGRQNSAPAPLPANTNDDKPKKRTVKKKDA